MNKILFLVLLFVSTFSFSNDKLPIDKEVTIGKLSNGMTYYIRHNVKPKDRADFYIIHNVGAILETDAQNGLAHFCEHMAFNGTKNFPKKGVLNFLEKIGVKFGHNINAFTGTDVTCYNLNSVPLTNEKYIDSALLVLHDWSNYISFEGEEIDAERGVIHEEWRTRRNAGFRTNIKHAPALYNNSKYSKRDVIGKIDVIDNCSYETMKSFYKDWYRPDLQAIVIVGDFDVKKMEKKVIKLFSKIPKAKNPKKRYEIEIPNNKKTLISIVTDPESTNSMFRVMYKHDIVKPENKDSKYLRDSYLYSLHTSMLNTRLGEIVQKANPPFIVGQCSYGAITRTKNAYSLITITNPNTPLVALKALLEENMRVNKFGFTQGELDRQIKNYLTSIENSYKEKDKRRNNSFIWKYFGNFLTNEPITGIEFNTKFAENILKKITLKEINKFSKNLTTKENIVITFTAPKKEGIKVPTKDEIIKTLANSLTAKLIAYKDSNTDKELIDESSLKSGKIVKSTKDKDLDTEELILENGIKVVLKKTDFKEDQILFSAYSPGGSSLYPANYIPSISMANTIVQVSGLGEFNNIDLRKKLTGKNVRVSPSIGSLFENINGSSTVKDFETMFQLIHLYFTNPRFDKVAYNAYMSRIKGFATSSSLNPAKIFQDSVSLISSNHHPRVQPFTPELLEKVGLSKIKEMYLDRFKDASDFTFFFVGNIDIKETKRLIKKYIANLPNIHRVEKGIDNGIRPPKNITKRIIKQKLEVDKATVYVNFTGKIPYNLKNRMEMNAFEHILQLRYTETIREKEGGSYGVGVRGGISKFPYEKYSLTIRFDCDPAKKDKLLKIVYQEINKIVKNGPSQVDLDKSKKYFTKTRKERLRLNGFWLTSLKQNYMYNFNMIDSKDFNNRIDNLTIKTIKGIANKINMKKYVEIINMPIKK